MIQIGILLRYRGVEHDRPQVLFFDQAGKCARFLGLTICTDVSCRAHDQRLGPHSHIDVTHFGRVEQYPSDDVELAGQKFRRFVAPSVKVTIIWHYWARHADPPVVYYVRADIVIALAQGGR